ncbi:MAG: tRNA (adenosine(37)-N6)-threonylcarbamoyltransferase complex dimerization subunit type 1 TsaB [Flavisolibacter sp.]|nr:tRNA (adenosine(37)-N6)-threonylcarbamoyltransferase complex dimerization subunit type 1 TsaB [Flavisolibacter sp.]
MSLLLHIDTALEAASVCLSQNETVLRMKGNTVQKDSATWLHTAIKELLQEHQVTLQQLSAVAVSAGPGSYTGLRVGMATAKGLCYAAALPLITINTLQMMAVAALEEDTDLLCPMIDARRMEVFLAVYNKELGEVVPPQNCILQATALHEWLHSNTITFFGSGSTKFREILNHPNAFFKNIPTNAKHLVPLAYKSLQHQQFADLAYCEPFYGKEFYSPSPKKM